VKPIPVVFHIGPLQVHTYGIGLAVTFWFAYRYFAKRLRDHGYPDAWLGMTFVWIIVASVVGARAAHVISNWGTYSRDPGDILAVWHGGLSSFGGLALGVPTGLYLAHRWCKPLRLVAAADLVAPVLALAWAIGRLLGPQLMVSGGGYPTTAWYGMEYAGQVGKRVPVPIFQGVECFVVFLLALQVEKYIARRGGPLGVVVTATVTFYGATRLFDESVLLQHGEGGFAVEIVSGAFIVVGAAFCTWLLWRGRGRTVQVDPETGRPRDPWENPERLKAEVIEADTDEAGEGVAGIATAGEQQVSGLVVDAATDTGNRDPEGVRAGRHDLA